MERLQDKLRQERTNDQPILNRCDFDIVERYVDSSSEEGGGAEEEEEEEQRHGEHQGATEQPRQGEQRPSGRAGQTNPPPRVSFPPALHRSLLNLQKDNLQERLNLGKIYGALDAVSDVNASSTVNTSKTANTANGGGNEPNGGEKASHGDADRKGGSNQVKEKHQLTFQLNQNEMAKLQWTNPVRDEEVRVIKNFGEIKLHEVRFDFEGKLRIQINETELNMKKKKKVFNNFDGLYHHNDEPLNSGYTFPEMIFLCQSSHSNQVSIALKIMANVCVNSRLRAFPFDEDLASALCRDRGDLHHDESNSHLELRAPPRRDKYSFGFTYRRFFTYLNSDLNLFDKLLFLLRHCRNRNIEMGSIHCLDSYTFPNNVCSLKEDVVFDYWGEGDSPVLRFFHDYEVFSYLDLFSDGAFLFEGCNVYFCGTRKGGAAKPCASEDAGEEADEQADEHADEHAGKAKLGGEETGHSRNHSEQWEGTDWSEVARKLKRGDAAGGRENRAKWTNGPNGENPPTAMVAEVPIEEELIAHLEPISSISDDLQEMQKINVKMVHLGGFHKSAHEDILTNISTILQNNFGVVEVENSCVCLLIGLLARCRQQVNLLSCTDLMGNLQKIYESKIIGSELHREREHRGVSQADHVETNFTYNLITLIRYVIIYNYHKDLLQKFKVLSFLLFHRSLPFIRKDGDRRRVFFLATEVLKVCRLLLFCNLYVEPVDYFHEVINHLNYGDIQDDHGVYEKFLSQVYLYLATYNIVGSGVDLSGFLYTNKVISTLQIRVGALLRRGVGKRVPHMSAGDADTPTGDTPTGDTPTGGRQKTKWDFALLCELQLIHQCAVYLFSVFWSVRRKRLIGEKHVGCEQLEALLQTLQVLLRAVIERFDALLGAYAGEPLREQPPKEPPNEWRRDARCPNVVQKIIRRMTDGPLPFSYVIYKDEIDWHFFFVILLQIVNTILLIVAELPFSSLDKGNQTTLKHFNRIAEDVATFERDTLIHFKRDVFYVEHGKDSCSLFLPLSYLFYNIYGFRRGTHLMWRHTDQFAENAVERLLYSLSFCSSVPLSYFCLRAIFATPSEGSIIPGGETNGGISSSQKCDHLGSSASDEMDPSRGRSNGCDERMIGEATPINGDHVDIPKNIILFLGKYVQGKFLLYHSKKSIFLLLLKNLFRECNRRCEEASKKRDALVQSVLTFLLNRHIIHFIGKHMDVSIFFKYFIQIFIIHEGKSIGDSLGEKREVYANLVRIAEEYIFRRVASTDSEGEPPPVVRDIHRVVNNFGRENPPSDANGEGAHREDGPGVYPLNTHLARFLKTNRRSINACTWQKRIQISAQLSVAIFEKIIESFKMAYFFSPLMFAILFFLSSTSFPEECRNVFYRDTDLMKILSKNVFIRFSDDGMNYIVFTTSTCYGREETNFLIDLTPLFPSILSLLLDDSQSDWFPPTMQDYFGALRAQYPYPSLLHFLFYVSANGGGIA
ncbi:RNA polymerase II-associated protein 1, putative [Plasmodium vivax]|uniref:RNA polymerase II-associated protein 1, putative n=1 Tax=Plasmodium vivax TaxID=5855 RepID=A0A1G4H9Z7_PLAVI|nr:RNA polymerase II-associated protein 1, putative [Plasmodium vivax]